MRVRTVLLAACVSAAMSSYSMAQVTGKIKLDGKPPEMKEIDMSGVKECHALHPDPIKEETVVAKSTGELANVVIWVKTDDPDALGGSVPKDAAVLDQKGCQYVPHVLPVMIGQQLKVKNDDSFLHNVHSLATVNPAFNFAQPNKDPGKAVDSPKTAEIIKVKCDVHPWMSAWILAINNPFFAVTKTDGTFEIKGLADGDYVFNVWHEKFASTPVEVKATVKGGKAEINHTFKATAMAPSEDNIKLASLTTSADADGCAACETPAATSVKVQTVMAVKSN
jgi:hypothetical protein